MGEDIFGWVEFRHPHQDKWQPIIRLDGFLSRYPDFQRFLFEEERGLPPNTWPTHEYDYQGDDYGLTYLYYDEWVERWEEFGPDGSHQSYDYWATIDSWMADLATVKGTDNVRIVAWFHW